MMRLRPPESIHQAQGFIQNGTFTGRWHFSFDDYADPEYVHFGSLRAAGPRGDRRQDRGTAPGRG